MQSVRHYLALLKKVCRIAYKDGHSERYFFCNFKLQKQEINASKALTLEEFVKVRDVEISVKRKPSLALNIEITPVTDPVAEVIFVKKKISAHFLCM